MSADGLMGMLGGMYVFDHWSGDSTAATETASVAMDGPRTLTAEWRVDNTMPYTILGTILVATVISIGLLVLRKRRSGDTRVY